MAGDIQLIVNTPYGVGPRVDGYEIRTAAVIKGVPCITTVQGLAAAVQGIDSLQHDEPTVRSLQEHAIELGELRRAQYASDPMPTTTEGTHGAGSSQG
jgi:carbamoyl-phosphate synthase large subunit